MTDKAVIREYKDQDKADVLNLLKLNIPDYFSPEEEKDLIYYLDNEIEYYFVVEFENIIVGSGGFNFSGDETNGKISWDIFHPDSQGKSLGSMLLNYRIEKLKMFKSLKTITVRTSQLVFEFYEKQGFKLIEIVKDYWAKDFHLYKMEYIKGTNDSDSEKLLHKFMSKQEYTVRNAKPSEFDEIGKLMVQVYSQLEGFPKESEQPNYYKMLANIGELTNKPETELLVAVSSDDKIGGAVVYFSDMKYYGSGGTATREQNAAGFRLLAADSLIRGQGIGKLLTNECIRKAKDKKLNQMVIHTTMAMQRAWKMYENLGFKRSEDLDFMQGELPVFGFRLPL